MTRYWLMKCEPDAYTIDDLERDGRTSWEGVRNYQARNLMRDDMQVGDCAPGATDASRSLSARAFLLSTDYPDRHGLVGEASGAGREAAGLREKRAT